MGNGVMVKPIRVQAELQGSGCESKLILSCVCVCVHVRAPQLQSEWEAVSLELEQWLVCERQLEDVLLLHTLLLVPPPQGTAGGAVVHCSVKSLLEGGKGLDPTEIFSL